MRCFVAWLLLVGVCSADQLPILEEYTPIVVDHDAGSKVVVSFFDAGTMKHRFLDDKHFFRGESQTVWVAPPGNYVVYGGSAPMIVDILPGGSPGPSPGPRPDPSPGPSPRPDPPEPEPDPAPDGIFAKWAVLVEEINDRAKHPKKTDVLTDSTYWDSLKDRNIRWQRFDASQPQAQSYLKIIKGDLPAMVLLEEDGKVFRVFDLPETTDEVDQIIRENVLR